MRYYRSTAKDQITLSMRLRDLAAVRVRYGYRRLQVLLMREGWQINRKRVYRLYRQEGLALRLKRRRKQLSAPRVVHLAPEAPNDTWSMDFISDRLYTGQRFRALTVVDNFSRESPAIVVDRSIMGKQVVALLEELKGRQGLPKSIQVDNGPEFVSKALDEWAHRNGVQLHFSRPGTPTDNPYIEAFNGRFREECLNQHWFTSLNDACATIEAWRVDYNQNRPHSALEQATPTEFKVRWQHTASSCSASASWRRCTSMG